MIKILRTFFLLPALLIATPAVSQECEGVTWYDPLLELTLLPDNTVEIKMTDRTFIPVDYEIIVSPFLFHDIITFNLPDSGQVFTFTDTIVQPGQTYTYYAYGIFPETCFGFESYIPPGVSATISIPDESKEGELSPPLLREGASVCENKTSLIYSNVNEGSKTEIWRSRSPDSGFELIAVEGLVGGYIDRDLGSRKTYYYKSRAVTETETSKFSKTVVLQSGPEWFPPYLELSISANNTVEGKLTDRSYFDSSYEIKALDEEAGSFTSFFAKPTMTDSGSVFTFTDPNVQPGKTYIYYVDANLSGSCAFSEFNDVAIDSITISIPGPDESSFTLVNADTDEDIQTLSEGDVITLSENTHYNIRYNASGSPGSVIFEHQGRVVRRENKAPYSLAGDRSGDYFPWVAATPGEHSVAATPYSESGGHGTPHGTHTVNFRIVADEGTPSFTLVNADTDEDIRRLDDGDVFVKPADMNLNIRYNPAGTTLSVVFKHNDVTVRKENASPFALAGDRTGDYFPWAQATPGEHKIEATPYDELDRMGTAGETLVIHFTIEETGNETFARAGEVFSQLSIYPNPAKSHETELSIAGFERIKQPMITEVQIIKLTGEIVFSDKISCGGDCGSYLIQVNEQLVPGLYMVNMKTNGLRFSKRLVVR